MTEPIYSSLLVQAYAERCGLAAPSALSAAERLRLAFQVDPATARERACPFCHGSGIQIRGRVSGMSYEIACDCVRGRRNSNLCTIGNPRHRNHRRERRANLGGANRNARGESRRVSIEEVWAGMEC